jgi:hypothetical protein
VEASVLGTKATPWGTESQPSPPTAAADAIAGEPQGGDQYLTGKEFAARLSRRGEFTPKKKHGMRGWSGLTLVAKQEDATWTADEGNAFGG